ncbi:MAG: transpeptidase family protein [Candidatus Abyssubacteria bacterium]|nr:transpeptidase family protein [Candidatus Abyssubacteria bacterium]
MHEDLAFKTPGSVLAGEKLENPSRLRAKLCLCLLLAGFAAIGIKLVTIQVFRHEFWARYVDDQRKSAILIQPRRGTIYARNKKTPLATSVVQEVLCVAPQRVTDVDKLARALASYAKMPEKKIAGKIRKTPLYLIYLRRGLDLGTMNEIKAMKLGGVEFRSESARHYPKGVLAGNLIGFANLDNKGLEGIEYKFDALLAGEVGKQIVIKDNSRREITSLAQTVKEARDGSHIVLTIDESIQYITEKALDGIIDEFSPESASAVVIEPRTGQVLAMAGRPTFDPNNSSTYKPERLRNRAIIDTFEPGSAFKPIAAAAALERGAITPEDRVYCELGAMRYHGHTFNDVHPLAEITFAEVIAQSSNIGMIKVVSMLSPDTLYEYIRGFGFGKQTGINLPGESSGILRPPSKWSGLSMGSLPIGQEVSVTALQLAVAFSAIANKGRMMRPFVISEILSADGEVLERNMPTFVRQVIRPETAKSLTEMLEGVVTSGTGTAAKVDGYRCAGKTGTAQKPDLTSGGYYRDKYVAVFAGFVPADDPAACIVVMADSPQGKHYGGQVAAPAFREIAKGILNYLEIPPTEPEEPAPAKVEERMTIARAPAEKEGPSALVLAGEDGLLRMPDIRGMTMRAIIDSKLAGLVSLEFIGSGVAVSQRPAPGARIKVGERCQIAFMRIDTK